MGNSNFLVRNAAALTFKLEIDFCHCHHDKAMLLFMLVVLAHFIYWQESNHAMYHTPHQALAAFNEHPIENVHLLCGHGLRGRLHASVSRDSAFGSECCHAIVSTQILEVLLDNPCQAVLLSRVHGQNKETRKWKLANLFGSMVVTNRVLPLGFSSLGRPPNPTM